MIKLENMFSEEELNIFSAITPTHIDVDALKQYGDVYVKTEENDGVITETYNFISNSRKINFTKVLSRYKHVSNEINVLSDKLEVAIENEDYIEAANINNKLKELKSK